MAAVLERLEQDTPEDPELLFWCPGCRCCHWAKTTGGRPLWTWNGSLDAPTFHPSILVNESDPASRCHLYVEDGALRYLADCWHGLRGQTIPMEAP